MQKNEIKAEQDIAKIGMQSFVGLTFALVLQMITGRLVYPMLHYGLLLFSLLMIAYFIRKLKYLGKELDKLGE